MENSTQSIIPTKHDEKIQPIVTQVDLLRLPVFLVNDVEKEYFLEDFDGHHFINGDPCVKIQYPEKMGADESDVCHGLVHLGKLQGFRKGEIRFVAKKFLELIGWGISGREYNRLKKALDNLSDISLQINVGTKNRSLWKKLQFFNNPELFIDRKNDQQDTLPVFLSSIQVGKPLLKLCEEGRLKEVHPYYFSFKRKKIAKRIFGLISARASDLKIWKISIYELKDLIPLKGKKYKTKSGIKQRILPALDYLKEHNIIFGYEDRGDFLLVQINNDYFYSTRFPKKTYRLIPEKKQDDISETGEETTIYKEVCQALISRGMERSTAEFMAMKHPERSMEKIEIFDFLKAQGKAFRNPGAYLRRLIKDDLPAPENFKSRQQKAQEDEKRGKQQEIINEADILLKEEKYEEAIKKAAEIPQYHPRTDAIIRKAREALNTLEEEKKTQEYIRGLSHESFISLKFKAVKRFQGLGLSYQPPEGIIESRFDETIFSPKDQVFPKMLYIVAKEEKEIEDRQLRLPST